MSVQHRPIACGLPLSPLFPFCAEAALLLKRRGYGVARAGGGHTFAAAAPTLAAAFKSLAEKAPVPECAAEATRAAA